MVSRYPHELSGGQKQRVVIATALVLDPDLLILDEPTSALDVSVQAQIMNLLKELKADPGISMIFITHDIGLAATCATRWRSPYAGQHVEFGPAERVLVEPRHPYTQLLLASLPRLHEAVRPGPDARRAAGPDPPARRLPLSTPAAPTPFEPCRRGCPLRSRCRTAATRGAGLNDAASGGGAVTGALGRLWSEGVKR
jgi:ABC-type dipeptide/oligopeptide/nickel transport system ATPase component